MMRYFEKQVSKEEDGAMVKEVIRTLGAGRQLRRRMLEQQLIQVNGKPAFLTERVREGDFVTMDAPADEPSILTPENLPFNVAYEDDHLLIADKPADMLVHPTAKERTGTLANAVLYYMLSKKEQYPFRPLHRLDRDTSGLLVIAKHKLTLERLEKALKRREIKREYVAFTQGRIGQKQLTIDAPIGLLPNQTIKRGIVPDGRSARTHLKVLQWFPEDRATKVHVSLETGRTHQIRVHLAHLGHPVLGDGLYGRGSEYGLQRQALHAANLTFEHPFTHSIIRVSSALPEDLAMLEKELSLSLNEKE